MLKTQIKHLDNEVGHKAKLINAMNSQIGNTTVMKQLTNIKQKVTVKITIDTFN